MISEEEAEHHHEFAYSYYKNILENKPNYVPVIIDIADYWEQNNKFTEALRYYDIAIDLIEKGIYGESLADEAKDAFYKKASVLKERNRNYEAEFCLAQRRRFNPESILLNKNV